MANYLWASSIALAELIDRRQISLRGKTVLELGAGSGLPSILATLNKANRVFVTDYPDKNILKTIELNVKQNIASNTSCFCMPLNWGDMEQVNKILAVNFGKFDTILMADTLWLADVHEQLLGTCRECLKSNGEILLACFDHSVSTSSFTQLNKVEMTATTASFLQLSRQYFNVERYEYSLSQESQKRLLEKHVALFRLTFLIDDI